MDTGIGGKDHDLCGEETVSILLTLGEHGRTLVVDCGVGQVT